MLYRTLVGLLICLAMVACEDSSTPEQPSGTEPEVSDQPEQTISELNDEFRQRLEAQRSVVKAHLGNDPENLRKFETAAGKLGTIRAILDADTYTPDDTYELQCLGTVLGDAFVQDMGMQWIIVTDEYGTDPALRCPDTTVIVFPLTMISKRVERGEAVDVFYLFDGLSQEIERWRSEGP